MCLGYFFPCAVSAAQGKYQRRAITMTMRSLLTTGKRYGSLAVEVIALSIRARCSRLACIRWSSSSLPSRFI